MLECVRRGKAAESGVVTERPDICVLDIQLADRVSGFELARRIMRATRPHAHSYVQQNDDPIFAAARDRNRRQGWSQKSGDPCDLVEASVRWETAGRFTCPPVDRAEAFALRRDRIRPRARLPKLNSRVREDESERKYYACSARELERVSPR